MRGSIKTNMATAVRILAKCVAYHCVYLQNARIIEAGSYEPFSLQYIASKEPEFVMFQPLIVPKSTQKGLLFGRFAGSSTPVSSTARRFNFRKLILLM